MKPYAFQLSSNVLLQLLYFNHFVAIELIYKEPYMVGESLFNKEENIVT